MKWQIEPPLFLFLYAQSAFMTGGKEGGNFFSFFSFFKPYDTIMGGRGGGKPWARALDWANR